MSIVEKLKFGFEQRLPIILQTETTECGLACLAMVMGFYGHETDLATLRQKFSISLKGASLKYLIEMGQRLNLNSRAVRLELEDIGKLSMPCILHWNFNHFVVLKSVNNNEAIIHDPAFGIKQISLTDLSKHFTGVALQLMPTAEFKQKKEVRTFSWRQLIGTTRGLKSALVKIFGLALALEAMVVIGPILNQLLYDHVLVTADTNLLVLLIAGLVLLEITRIAINVVRAWAVMIMSATLSVQWISNVFAHLMRLPIPWFEKRHTGDVVSRFNAIHAIQGSLTTRFVETILDGLLSIGALVMMLLYNATLTLVVIFTVLAYWGIRTAWYGTLKRMMETQLIFEAKQQSYFLESLRTVRSVRLFNATNQRHSTWLNCLVDERNVGLKAQRYGIFMDVGNNLLFSFQNMTVMGFGALAVLHNQWSLGMLLAFMSYKEQFARRGMALVDKIMELRMLNIQAERLSDIVLTEREPEFSATVNTDLLSPSLSIKNVSFKYGDGEPWVIRNFDLEINPGESVAIIGSSGCGKTTLLKLMLGLAQPDDGDIIYGGVSLKGISSDDYRELIGVVMQDDQLFSGSVAENISFFTPEADQEWIETCAKTAAIHNEIMAMPMAYHSLVGDMGTTLSGGQKQRILLARALYKKPKILFLDEATSHLDVVNESQVNNMVRQLGVTTIIIAHRPETIRMADRVILVEQGRAVEIGKEVLSTLIGSANKETKILSA